MGSRRVFMQPVLHQKRVMHGGDDGKGKRGA
jgi:hypothetical protein